MAARNRQRPRPAGAARADRRGRSRTAGPAQPPRRPGAGGRRDQEARGLGGLSARARGAGHRRAEGRQPRPAADRQRGADLARDHVGLPRAGDAARAWPTSARPAPSANRRRSAYFGSSIVRVPCASIDEVFRSTTAGAADFGVVPVENSTEGVVARSLDLFLHHAAVHHRRDQPVRAPQPAAQDRTRSTASSAVLRPPAGAGAMPRLAEPTTCRTSSAGRWPATPKARAWRRSTPRWPRIASERAASEYGLHVVAPAIQDDAAQPHPLRHRHATPSGIRSRRPRATTAPAWWSR